MRVVFQFVDLARQLDTAGVITLALEPLGLHRRDFAREEPALLCGHRALERTRGVSIHFRPRDLIFLREILGGVAHRHAGCGIQERFPEKVLELDLAHAETVARRITRDRIAAHRLRADAQREIDAAMRDRVRRLHDDFDAGAADALDHVRGHFDRHAGIETDMTRQHVGVEARLRHVAGNDDADIFRRELGLRECLARDLDAHVDRRN